MDEVQLANYLAGIDPGPIEAGRVDLAVARLLSVSPSSPVFLSDYTLTKTRFRHPDIDYQDYCHLPTILSRGYVVRGRSPLAAEIVHVETRGNNVRGWDLVLKKTAKKELFVTMFHRTNLVDARRLYRRASRNNWLVRDVKDEMTRHLLGRVIRA